MDAVFGKDDEVHERVGFAGFGDEVADMLGGVLELGGCQDFEELGLAEADYDGVVGGLIKAAQSRHGVGDGCCIRSCNLLDRVAE